ncbi:MULTISPECIES: hypothetical protein [unclassified Shinella]|uniref:hypothetical protein n=1 Tax=unclassified Shinella TaxID=2643062 RepID=UPI00234F7B6C|nr:MULTISPECIES: hypothetical protein [unclassified Shinella]CAK7261719.1 conserved protein of unknown function [Shinella sp. WSC3-e]MDC7259762.1 hypothetical protein [Shinella sp. YE25]MDC7260365.1 hypothetical protein [Shinella sp. YE25]MDC7267067.1 hypothetical protein [Shinella sp. HY16]MDC7267258.1 hypothetical protein [Shinella sp. HY16]
MTIKQTFFNLADLPKLAARTWTPLRRVTESTLNDLPPRVISVAEFHGTATAAVHSAKSADVDTMGWNDVGLNPHRAGMESWGYQSSDVFRGWGDTELGINLVIAQHLEEPSKEIWHLHPDLVVALRLIQEGDRWYRPEEGWPEVVRLARGDNGEPVSIEIKTEFLNDYLAARGMRLFCSSYAERTAVTEKDPGYGWSRKPINVAEGRDLLEYTTTSAGWPNPRGSFFTRGAIWRTEWLEPGTFSPRVRGDKPADEVSFVTKPDGTRVAAARLHGDIGWLYFDPGIINALLRHRGGRLHWASRDTGGVGATSDTVHFGVNDLGLITVFAKDIGMLKPWEQRIWAAHNVTPDGGVSKELFEAQMMVQPASTKAPEALIEKAVDSVASSFRERYGQQLLRENAQVPDLFTRAHRFRSAETEGLLELSKQLTQLFTERVDVDVVLAQCPPLAKGEKKPGSLKAIERLLGTVLTEEQARKMMGPLFGMIDLRNAGSHLGSTLVQSGLERLGVDGRNPQAVQGLQLLESVVNALLEIDAAIAVPKPPAS